MENGKTGYYNLNAFLYATLNNDFILFDCNTEKCIKAVIQIKVIIF